MDILTNREINEYYQIISTIDLTPSIQVSRGCEETSTTWHAPIPMVEKVVGDGATKYNTQVSNKVEYHGITSYKFPPILLDEQGHSIA